jgi:hypothetical protein
MVSDLYSRDENSRDLSVLTKEALLRRAEKSGFRVRTFEDHSAQPQENGGADDLGRGRRRGGGLRGQKPGGTPAPEVRYYLMVAEKI